MNDIGPHPDDDEFDTSAQSIDSLSELSDGTMQYMPQAESLKDKKLQRIAEQMRLGLAGAKESSNSKNGGAPDPERKVSEMEPIESPTPELGDVSNKGHGQDLLALGDQLKILVEKARRLHDSKKDTPQLPFPKQELPVHVSWMFATATNILHDFMIYHISISYG